MAKSRRHRVARGSGRRRPATQDHASNARWAGEGKLRILVGPYIEPGHCAYMEGAFDDYDVLTFGVYEGADIHIEGIYDLDHLLSGLPRGWTPDLMLLWRPEYTSMPRGLERADFPVAMLISDWYVAFTPCLEVARFVNAVITGTRGARVYRAAGFDHVLDMPMLGYQEGFDGEHTSELRDIDVLCAGNPNWNVHRERERVVAELMELPPEVRFIHSPVVDRAQYNRLLSRAKIFVNQTVIGEINMKCYEVPAAGACLFVEADNLDIRDYLVDGESVVLYRRGELRQKILYYLRHEEERAAIARSGQEAMQARSYRANMRDIVERLRLTGREALLRQGREIRRADAVRVAGHYLGYAARHTGYGLQQALDLARELPDELGPKKALLEGSLQYTAWSAPIDRRTGRPWQRVRSADEILGQLQSAWEAHPDDLPLNLAWAQVAGTGDEFERQIPVLDRLIDQLESGCRVPLGGPNLYTLPQAHRFVFERRAWEEVERGVPPDRTLRGILLEYAFGLRSHAHAGLGDEPAALEDLRRAVQAHPSSVLTRPRLVDALMRNGLREEAAEVGNAHLEQAPLDVALRVRLIENELCRDRPDPARTLLAQALRIARVFCDEDLVERLRLVERQFLAPAARRAELHA